MSDGKKMEAYTRPVDSFNDLLLSMTGGEDTPPSSPEPSHSDLPASFQLPFLDSSPECVSATLNNSAPGKMKSRRRKNMVRSCPCRVPGCKFAATTAELLRQHKFASHIESYKCLFCSRRFVQYRALLAHEVKHRTIDEKKTDLRHNACGFCGQVIAPEQVCEHTNRHLDELCKGKKGVAQLDGGIEKNKFVTADSVSSGEVEAERWNYQENPASSATTTSKLPHENLFTKEWELAEEQQRVENAREGGEGWNREDTPALRSAAGQDRKVFERGVGDVNEERPVEVVPVDVGGERELSAEQWRAGIEGWTRRAPRMAAGRKNRGGEVKDMGVQESADPMRERDVAGQWTDLPCMELKEEHVSEETVPWMGSLWEEANVKTEVDGEEQMEQVQKVKSEPEEEEEKEEGDDFGWTRNAPRFSAGAGGEPSGEGGGEGAGAEGVSGGAAAGGAPSGGAGEARGAVAKRRVRIVDPQEAAERAELDRWRRTKREREQMEEEAWERDQMKQASTLADVLITSLSRRPLSRRPPDAVFAVPALPARLRGAIKPPPPPSDETMQEAGQGGGGALQSVSTETAVEAVEEVEVVEPAAPRAPPPPQRVLFLQPMTTTHPTPFELGLAQHQRMQMVQQQNQQNQTVQSIPAHHLAAHYANLARIAANGRRRGGVGEEGERGAEAARQEEALVVQQGLVQQQAALAQQQLRLQVQAQHRQRQALLQQQLRRGEPAGQSRGPLLTVPSRLELLHHKRYMLQQHAIERVRIKERIDQEARQRVRVVQERKVAERVRLARATDEERRQRELEAAMLRARSSVAAGGSVVHGSADVDLPMPPMGHAAVGGVKMLDKSVLDVARSIRPPPLLPLASVSHSPTAPRPPTITEIIATQKREEQERTRRRREKLAAEAAERARQASESARREAQLPDLVAKAVIAATAQPRRTVEFDDKLKRLFTRHFGEDGKGGKRQQEKEKSDGQATRNRLGGELGWLPCDVHTCSARFSSRSSMLRHWRTLHKGIYPIRQMTCTIPGCGKVFTVKKYYERHMWTHKGQTRREKREAVKKEEKEEKEQNTQTDSDGEGMEQE